MNMFLTAFKMSTMKDYHKLYLKIYVLSLASVFSTFRRECLNFFQLDTAHYLSTPVYKWDAVLRFTDVNLKDTKKHQLTENMTRGDISMICKDYVNDNYKFLKSYNKSTSYTYT